MALRDIVKGLCDKTKCFFDVYTKDFIDRKLKELSEYSTEEVVVGKWINGKPIYRKVIESGQLPSVGTGRVNIGEIPIEEMIDLKAVAYHSNIDLQITIPYAYVNPTNNLYFLSIYISKVTGSNNWEIYFRTTVDMTAYTKSYTIIEYTKTTDKVEE